MDVRRGSGGPSLCCVRTRRRAEGSDKSARKLLTRPVVGPTLVALPKRRPAACLGVPRRSLRQTPRSALHAVSLCGTLLVLDVQIAEGQARLEAFGMTNARLILV